MADFEKIDNILGKLYYDPETGYGGIKALFRQAKAKGHKIPLAEIKRWLKEQDTYTLHKPIHRQFQRQKTRVTNIDEQFFIVIE